MKETSKWFSIGAVGVLLPYFLLSAYTDGEISALRIVPQARVLFVGDMMFDRYIRTVMERHGGDYVFSCSGSLFLHMDTVVGNLEGPITDTLSVSKGSVAGSSDNFVFTFPPMVAALLSEYNVGIVTLGNNHIGNMGWDGVATTKEHLSREEVGFFGGLAGDEPVHRQEIGRVPLSFVGYNEFGGNSARYVAELVQQEYELGRVVVVYAHWGDEYVDSSARLRPIADLFIESGAALVVGSHPHVVLGSEEIKGVPVYYSLGNFIFDQYWDESVTRGLALETYFSRAGVKKVVEHPVELMSDGRTCGAT